MSSVDDIERALTSFGVSALGLAGPQLAPQWAGADPTFNSASLTLTFSTAWNAPIGGTLSYSAQGAAGLSGLDGSSIAGNVALLHIHPQSHLRLERLYAQRYGDNTLHRSLRPVPLHVAIRVSSMPGPTPPLGEVHAGEALADGEVSFHDERGLIIDPLAVACVFADLLVAFPALLPPGMSAANLDSMLDGSGGARHIGTLDTGGTFVHFVTPHGGPWNDPGSGNGLHISGGSGGDNRVTGAGPFNLPSGANVAAESSDPNQPLRWGWATNGTLSATAFTLPAFPTVTPAVSLARDFVRLCVVNLNMHLLGNRTTASVNGVGPADDVTAAEPSPPVRDGAAMTYQVDGVGVLGTLAELLSGIAEGFLASPTIDDQFTLPPHPGANGRWDQFPATVGTAGSWDPNTSRRIRTDGITAAWVNIATSNDVVLTIAAGVIPAAAHVRVYPRLFVIGPSLSTGPTLFRGDGVSTIAPAATNPTVLLLHDPLNLGTTARPTDTRTLHFDLLVVPRPAGTPSRPRLFGGLNVRIDPSAVPPTIPSATNAMTAILGNHRAVCSVPLLGLPPRPGLALLDPSAWGSLDLNGLIALLRQLGSESPPREGPRFPTMARYDSIVALRAGTSSSPTWNGLLTGGFLRGESRSAAYRLGNPGAPAGPEIHALGIHVDGQLGYDLARAAIRRITDLVSRLTAIDPDTWNEPPAPSSVSASTMVGAVLQTIAPTCETPELSLYTASLSGLAGLPNDWNGLLQQITPSLGSLGNQLNAIPTPHNADRLVKELKREIFASQKGRRDAQWALRRAISEARELLYIEAPQFCATAHSSAAYTWDIVAALTARMTAQKGLLVILALPKQIAFGKQYGSWAKQGYVARNAAVASLQGVDSSRVVVFHPIGFPGRPLNIKSTVIIVDDVWCLLGTSVPRRRGFTFDGGADVVGFDRKLNGGYSATVRDFRRNLMALHLGAEEPTAGTIPSATWVRLGQPASAFLAVKELLDQGGRGLVEPLWPGTPDPPDGPAAQSDDVADPEGREVSALLTMLVSGLADLESNPI